jgi:hypothetical protein
MAVTHVASCGSFNLGGGSSFSTVKTLPAHSPGDLLLITVLGTPDTTIADPIVNVAGWTFMWSELADAAGTTLDLYIGTWYKVAGVAEPNPTVSWTVGFTSTSTSISNTRVSVIATALHGQLAVPQIPTGSRRTSPTPTPWSPADITLPRLSATVTITAQRSVTVPTINTANGFSSIATLTSGGLARALRISMRPAVPVGPVTMPTFNVSTSPASAALASITFDVPEVPVVPPRVGRRGLGLVRS